jgi:hypothetical protein
MRKHHNRLYYGRFRHKTVFRMPGTLMFYPTTDQWLTDLKSKYTGYSDIEYLADFIMRHRKTMKFRFQDRKAIFYTDQNLAQRLIDRFWEYWTASETVDPKYNKLDADTVGCRRLPHGKYQYQVHIKKDAQLLINEEQKKGLWEFLDRNVDECLVSNCHLLDYLESKTPYCFGGYFYVKEEKYLTPIYMMAQRAIDKVIKFRKVKHGSDKKTKR